MADLTYIAGPYGHISKTIIEKRIADFLSADAFLTERGYTTVSPLSKHFMVIAHDIPGNWDYWSGYSLALLERCSSMVVMMIPGWDTSKGVEEEMKYCRTNKIPIFGMQFNADGDKSLIEL